MYTLRTTKYNIRDYVWLISDRDDIARTEAAQREETREPDDGRIAPTTSETHEKMTIWPFGRKNSRKKGSLGLKTSATEPTMKSMATREGGRQNGSEAGAGEISRKRTGREKRRRSRESRKLQRDPPKRAYSYSPGRSENLGIRRDGRREYPPLPDNAAAIVARRAQTDDIARIPTLHKRTAQDLNRRKSSKKRKEDHDRAAEIKAMSKFMPTPMRVATTPDWSGSPIRRDTKKVHGINRLFTSTTSDVSLPIHDSLRSSMSSESERFAAYELKGMDLFTPRPTIRYSENPKFKQYESGVGVERSNSSKRKRALEKVPLPEEKPAYRKRIDDLADDLDAGALRELMERDHRRREQKRTSEREIMAQKVERRRERQKAEESQSIIHGNEPAKIMDRGVMGRELMGLGIEDQEPVETSAQQSIEPVSISDGAADARNQAPESVAQNLPAGILVNGSLPNSDLESPTSEQSEPVLATAQVARLSRATMSPPPSLRKSGHQRNASSVSQINDLPTPSKETELSTPIPQLESTLADLSKPDTSRTSFDTGSSSKQQSSWKSWFKKSSKEKRSSIQSSFSNTTRESTTVAPPPATVVYAIPIVHPPGSKRTMSRFREDLPELPMSPPYSRVQSPELDIPRVQPIEASLPMNITSGRRSAEPSSQMQLDTSNGHRTHLRYETPIRGHPADMPSPEPSNALSQSLASIDSEGSWLSGRARANSKRSSRQIPVSRSRDSHSSLMKRYRDLSDSAEELGIVEDEYYNRLTPGPEDMYSKSNLANRVSGNPMPSSDEEDGESLGSPVSKNSKWGEVAPHTPTIVHRQPRATSRQGKLNDFDDYDSGDDEKVDSPLSPHRGGEDSETAESPVTPVAGRLERATSVNYNKAHVRAISAGSARLLDVKPRASGESKRTSIG
ncbi:hypothetical protein V493_03602 [Pseudogymnoascus sp. VKM F-4281 (FW-2241)]|nr:hypothetical protein V493_03602 [Pseudogymnoascus sp. VKM F-4281 (FW-2241)]